MVLSLTPKTGRYGQISPYITILKTEARSFERYMGGPSLRDGPALRGPHKNPKLGLDEF